MGEWYLLSEPRSDWLTDPLQPERLTFSQLLNARDGADGTDGPTMHFGIAPCKGNEIRQRTDAVGKGCYSEDAQTQRSMAVHLSNALGSSSNPRHVGKFRKCQ
ncbi:unnamed protein product [Boreogadus saida]